MHIFYQPTLIDKATFLNEEESRHCVKVLRMKINDHINIADGVGNFYSARITDANAKKVAFEILEKSIVEKKPFHVHIAIAATKNADRMEWFVEKSVEIGIEEISFLNTANAERKKINIKRIQKKAISAMKQSQKASLPKINDISRLSDLLSKLPEGAQGFIAYVDKDIPQHLKEVARTKEKYIVLIGPEGDFTHTEIDMALKKGFVPVSLGNSRLRTETAGLVACHTLNLINE